jgi:hypothetical protein
MIDLKKTDIPVLVVKASKAPHAQFWVSFSICTWNQVATTN